MRKNSIPIHSLNEGINYYQEIQNHLLKTDLYARNAKEIIYQLNHVLFLILNILLLILKG